MTRLRLLLVGLGLVFVAAPVFAQEEEEPIQMRPAPDEAGNAPRLQVEGLGVLPAAGQLPDGSAYRISGNKVEVLKGGGKRARPAKRAAKWAPAAKGRYQVAGGPAFEVDARGIIIIGNKPAVVKALKGGKAAETVQKSRTAAPARTRGANRSPVPQKAIRR